MSFLKRPNKVTLETKIVDLKKCAKGTFGIELEVEGSPYFREGTYWTMKAENSLRNGGGEYVLTKPVFEEVLPEALKELKSFLTLSKIVKSIRCSTHIHVNVSQLTFRELYQVLVLYYLLEELLIQTQPEQRKGNLFCLRMSDAEHVFATILESLDGQFFYDFESDAFKYGALNLAAVQRYGSLEFRFLDAKTDTRSIENWCLIFKKMIDFGARTSAREIIRLYDTLPPRVFLKQIFPDRFVDDLTEGMTDQTINDYLHTNYDYVSEIARSLKNKKFSIPTEVLREEENVIVPESFGGMIVGEFGD